MMQPSILRNVERKSFADMHCSVAQCLEVVGEWWTMLIIRDAFLGVTRFDEFQERLGVARNILSQRLTRLVDQGILDKVAYSDHPLRYNYRLTAKGRDLWPILTAMRQWGDKHAAPDGPPLKLVHKSCGQVSQAVMTCSACGDPLTVRDVQAVPGPGDLDHLMAGGSPSSGPQAAARPAVQVDHRRIRDEGTRSASRPSRSRAR
jgi:DNA-binding HxlR family transcriptional regulator